MYVKTTIAAKGDEGRLQEGLYFALKVRQHREELQEQSASELIDALHKSFMNLYRFETSVYEVSLKGNKNIVAASVVAFVEDVHVGTVLSVEVAYSENPKAGRLLMREFQRIARDGNTRFIRLTKREAPYRYSVRYIKTRV